MLEQDVELDGHIGVHPVAAPREVDHHMVAVVVAVHRVVHHARLDLEPTDVGRLGGSAQHPDHLSPARATLARRRAPAHEDGLSAGHRDLPNRGQSAPSGGQPAE